MDEKGEFSKQIANKLMIEMARGVNESTSVFATWLLAGFSAAFGLILVNLDGILEFVEVNAVKNAFFLFLVSLLIAVIHKWLSAILQAGFRGGDEGEKVDSVLNQSGLTVNQELLLAEIERACLPPTRFLVKRQYRKLRSGDITVAGRQQLKLAQIQSFLMLGQILMAVLSIFFFIKGIKV